MFLNLFKSNKEKNHVSAREFLKNPNKSIKISLEDKDAVCIISNNAKRQVLQAILDFYHIKADLTPPRVRKIKVKISEKKQVNVNAE